MLPWLLHNQKKILLEINYFICILASSVNHLKARVVQNFDPNTSAYSLPLLIHLMLFFLQIINHLRIVPKGIKNQLIVKIAFVIFVFFPVMSFFGSCCIMFYISCSNNNLNPSISWLIHTLMDNQNPINCLIAVLCQVIP